MILLQIARTPNMPQGVVVGGVVKVLSLLTQKQGETGVFGDRGRGQNAGAERAKSGKKANKIGVF
jgi:hypothetical protein